MFLSSNVSELQRERRTAGLNREETKIPTTTTPKKGLIKLTALNHELQDPAYYDKQRDEEDGTFFLDWDYNKNIQNEGKQKQSEGM